MDEKQLSEMMEALEARRPRNHQGLIRAIVVATVTVLLTAMLAVIGTSYRQLQEHQVRIAVTEANVVTFINLLEKVDGRLEKLLDEMRRQGDGR